MRFGSVCSGIEAASVAFGPLGWAAAWFAEIDPFACDALAHHYPGVQNLGDMTTIAAAIRAGTVEAPDMLCGGTPCQSFSVAGQRGSMSDARGNLTLSFVELANAIDDVRHDTGREPGTIFWENVPGVLSTPDNAFGCYLGALAGAGYALQPAGDRWGNAGVVLGPKRAIAWRTLDAQYFGLAQRRKRVFVVASARHGANPAAVLFEFEGMRRDSAPSRQAGEVASTIPSRSTGGGGLGTDFDCDGGLLAFGGNNTSGPIDIATARNACSSASGRMDFESETFLVHKSIAFDCKASGQNGFGVGEIASTLRAMGHTGSHQNGGGHLAVAEPLTLAIRGRKGGWAVRRLTPVECERLMGFPDGYTAIPRGKKTAEQCADGPRYKALGNSWAVPCVTWIGTRIGLFL